VLHEFLGVNKTLGNGAKYEGQVNIGGSPSGSGKLFYPNEKNLGGGRLHYVGQFSHGLRHGLGLLYFTNGSMAFKGHFKNDQPNGISKSLLFDDE
jgi:antitoxin component YwqK of YwqJK toxin-antitoxin module